MKRIHIDFGVCNVRLMFYFYCDFQIFVQPIASSHSVMKHVLIVVCATALRFFGVHSRCSRLDRKAFKHTTSRVHSDMGY